MSTAKNSFFDLFKPRYHEATFRLKNSLIASIALLTVTHLLPLPTLYTSAWKFYRNSFHSPWEKGLAIAELSLFCLLVVNILQATIAIRSPPAPYPPLPSPASKSPSTSSSPGPRSKQGQQRATTGPAWRSGKSGVLSPNTTPQRQLAFSTSAGGSGSSGGGGGGGGGGIGAGTGSASDPRGLAQSYVLPFNSPSPDVSFSSSMSSLPSTPSPSQATSPLAAYRGRRAPTGRALDGSLLARLAQGESDSDADE